MYNNYNSLTMTSELPLHVQDTRPKSSKWCKFVDFSQPIFAITGSFGGAGLIVNSLQGESFDVALSGMMALGSLLAWFRVRRLGEAQSVMDSVQDLENQNQHLQNQTTVLEIENGELKESNDQLNDLENKLKSDLGYLRKVIGIADTQSKSAQQIQDEMIKNYKNYKIENDKYEKLNKVNTFLTSDINNDGVITNNEINLLESISLSTTSNLDYNNDGKITMEEYISK